MTTEEFNEALKILEWDHEEASRRIGVSKHKVIGWSKGAPIASKFSSFLQGFLDTRRIASSAAERCIASSVAQR